VRFGREMEVSTDTFGRQLDWMQARGEIVSLEEAIERRGEPGADRLFVLTFDDGFDDVYDNAFPLLKQRRLPFTLYLTTGPIETGEPLDSRFPGARPLTWGHINEMVSSGLVTVGAHTHTHADLTTASPEVIADELDTSNGLIEERTGVGARHFTYPWGWWSPTADPLVRERYASATTGGGGAFTTTADVYRIPRIPIQKSDGMVFFRRKLLTGLRMEDIVRSRLGSPASSNLLLFLINSLDPGGAERSLVELVPSLKDAGFEVVIACLKDAKGTLAEEARANGAEVVVLRSNGWLGRITGVRRFVRQRRPRLVHTSLFEADMVGRLATIGVKVPLVTSLVNTSYAPARFRDPNVTAWKLRVLQVLDGWTARHMVDRFHAVSQAVADAAVRDLHLDADKITVIHRSRNRDRLGEPSPERRKDVRERLGLPEEAFVALNVGRQEYQKGQRYLLKAMALLRDDHPEMVVLIAGREGNETEKLRALHTSLGLGDSVRFVGHRGDIGDLLSAADLFVFPSLYEGLGGALLEAMMMNVPIIASDLPAVREVVGDGPGVSVVPPGDEGALAEAIRGCVVAGETPPLDVFRRRFDETGLGQRRMTEWLEGSSPRTRQIVR
jgi:glycosyltransferase involved in cell wall biosynthesis